MRVHLLVDLPIQILSGQDKLALLSRDLWLLVHLQAQLPVWLLACRFGSQLSSFLIISIAARSVPPISGPTLENLMTFSPSVLNTYTNDAVTKGMDAGI